MISKMEGCSADPVPDVPTTSSKSESEVEAGGEAGEDITPGDGDDGEQFTKEKNLLLLSALYYLYGDEWKEAPDWEKVTETIKQEKIPVYGEDFTPELCEQKYKLLMENGVQLGIADVQIVLKPPKRLTESEKRLWIIAQISTDIVRISNFMDGKLRHAFKAQQAVVDKISNLEEITDEFVAEEFKYKPADDPGDDPQYEDEFEDEDAEAAAAQLWQLEVMEEIVGMKDVLVLVKYCNDAAAHAVDKYATIMNLPIKEKPTAVAPASTETPTKVDPLMIAPRELLPTIKNEGNGNEESVNSDVAGSSLEEKPKSVSPSKPLQPETPAMDSEKSETSGKLPDGSPQKQSSKPSTRNNSRDGTPADSRSPAKEVAEITSAVTPQKSSNGEEPSPSSKSSTVASSPAYNAERLTEDGGAVGLDQDLRKYFTHGTAVQNTNTLTQKKPDDTDDDSTTEEEADLTKSQEAAKDAAFEKTMGEVVAEVISELPDVVRDGSKSPIPAKKPEPPKEPEKVAKGRRANRKSVGMANLAAKRTSSRLATPEPSESVQNEEDKLQKRTRGRHASNSDANTLKLRRRRGATPTSAVAEKDSVEATPVNSKGDVANVEGKEDDTLETTPQSLETKAETDKQADAKPKLKTYSVKPPSPFSNVDPKIFDDFVDDEDDPELAMIDNNVNKPKSDKVTVPKNSSRRGRNVSSENTSENNEDNANTKRATRRGAPNDDIDNESSDDKAKRLTRSSLKLHDASNEEGTDPSSRTGSEKAGSESSFGGKDKKSQQSKSVSRVKKILDEKQRIYGDDDMEEKTLDGKRVTRARAKTGTSFSEKRTKLTPSESEGGNENESTPTRATRSRASTGAPSTLTELPVASQLAPVDEAISEATKLFRKNALSVLEKIIATEHGSGIQKYLDDPEKVIKRPFTFNDIKQKIETGKSKSLHDLYNDLILITTNVLFAYPNSIMAKDAVTDYMTMLKYSPELNFGPTKPTRSSSSHKMDVSDVESLESHDESRGETVPKPPVSIGGRRKRRRSASETSEEVFVQEKRRVTRTSVSSYQTPTSSRKTKHPISPDIVSANRVRH